MRKFAIRSVLATLFLLAASAASFGQVGISITIAPPPLPVYAQPVCPGDGYIWTPGYWAWDPDASDYYWVPGTWVLAPQVGFLWTPGWWGWGNGFYLWHAGYWGPVVGFYGGINYGFGYFGHGFYGGRWEGGHFFYNREVNNVNVNIIHNVYNEHVDVREESHVSFNGGHGGIDARPTREEEAAERERHIAPVADQVRQEQAARSNRELRASFNHGKPPIAATARPGAFNEHEPAKEAGGAYNPPARGETSRNASSAVHAKELPPLERPAAPNTGNEQLNKKYQQQQEKLYNKQVQERQNLQAKQEQEDQRLQQQRASQAKVQQQEQRHQQQTQQMYQRHNQQTQQLQSKQQSSHGGSKPR